MTWLPGELAFSFGSGIAQAVAVSKGIIQKVDSNVEVFSFSGPATRVIDLKGRTATRGIIDSHNHMRWLTA
jgi:predicted amidohydrolase YtcJ